MINELVKNKLQLLVFNIIICKVKARNSANVFRRLSFYFSYFLLKLLEQDVFCSVVSLNGLLNCFRFLKLQYVYMIYSRSRKVVFLITSF